MSVLLVRIAVRGFRKKMRSIDEEYLYKHPTSKRLYSDAQSLFPSGVTHDTRYVEPFPIYMTHGSGPRKWDVDGNEYLCYVMGHGSLILGHSHPAIIEAVSKQMSSGTHLGSCTELEIRWGNAVKKLMPSIEKIRFHSSGTEATLMALRLARAFTGKNKIIKFKDHFHGWHDYVLQDSTRFSSAGIPEMTSASVVTLPAGDAGILEKRLREDKDTAAVILEPTGAAMGCLPLKKDFLVQIRKLTESYGAVLVFDEVVTGFRISQGGAQVRFGIKPDLTALAKILAGGLPGGAVGGKSEIMEMLCFRDDQRWNRSERVSHPGTYNANPLSAAAGTTCLELIATEPINSRAEEAARFLKAGLNRIMRNSGVPGFAYGFSSLVWVVLGKAYEDKTTEHTFPYEEVKIALISPLHKVFKRALLNEGVDIMGTGEFILSASHTQKDIEDTLEAFEKTVFGMKKEGLL
jgi:glutamate-1-semialdehyde 2,1-aminomutase